MTTMHIISLCAGMLAYFEMHADSAWADEVYFGDIVPLSTITGYRRYFAMSSFRDFEPYELLNWRWAGRLFPHADSCTGEACLKRRVFYLLSTYEIICNRQISLLPQACHFTGDIIADALYLIYLELTQVLLSRHKRHRTLERRRWDSWKDIRNSSSKFYSMHTQLLWASWCWTAIIKEFEFDVASAMLFLYYILRSIYINFLTLYLPTIDLRYHWRQGF